MSEMSALEADLKHKIGPVPVWGYGVGFSAVLIIYLRWSAEKKAKAAAAAAATTAANGAAGAAGGAQNPNAIDPTTGLTYAQDAEVDPSTGLTYGEEAEAGYSDSGDTDSDEIDPATGLTYAQEETDAEDYVGSEGSTSTGTGTPSYSTNSQWELAASDYIISTGAVPTTVAQAFSDYLDGNTLTSTEQAIINEALQLFGLPPDPPSTPSTATTGATTPAVPTTPTPAVTPSTPTPTPAVQATTPAYAPGETVTPTTDGGDTITDANPGGTPTTVTLTEEEADSPLGQIALYGAGAPGGANG